MEDEHFSYSRAINIARKYKYWKLGKQEQSNGRKGATNERREYVFVFRFAAQNIFRVLWEKERQAIV